MTLESREPGRGETPMGRPFSSVCAAEDFAFFRANMEHSIFDLGVPAEQWTDLYISNILKYPRLIPYRRAIIAVVSSALANHDNLEKFWSEYQDQKESERSNKMCEGLFGFTPENGVSVVKGPITASFIFEGSNDFKKMVDARPGGHEDASGTHSFIAERGFSVIGYQTKSSAEEHELGHAKDIIVYRGLKILPGIMEENNSSSTGVEKINSRFSMEDGKMDLNAKSEILSYISEIEIPEDNLLWIVLHSNMLQNLGEQFTHEMAEPGGAYFETYKTFYNPSSEEAEQYHERVKRGLDAFTKLYDLYFKLKPELSPFRMSINVLHQFPLKDWPALTALISKKHNQQ